MTRSQYTLHNDRTYANGAYLGPLNLSLQAGFSAWDRVDVVPLLWQPRDPSAHATIHSHWAHHVSAMRRHMALTLPPDLRTEAYNVDREAYT